MTCVRFKEKIEPMRGGLLPPKEEEEVRKHLEACLECQNYIEETDRIGELLREYVKEEVESLPENVILGRVEAEIRELEEKGESWVLRNLRYLVPAFISAVALILILFYPSKEPEKRRADLNFTAVVESVEAENATVMIVDRGMDTPKVIWIIEREEI